MKIAFITYTYPPQIGGMQKWNQQMAEAYAKGGQEVDVFHLATDRTPHSSRFYRYIPVRFGRPTDPEKCPPHRYSIGMIVKTAVFVLFSARRLARYDIWQITVGEPQFLRILLWAASLVFPITLISGVGGVVFRSNYTGISKRLKLLVSKAILARSDLILVDGDDIKTEITAQGVQDSKVVICYAGVDTIKFRPPRITPSLAEYAQLRSKPLLSGKKTVLYCSRFSPENSPEEFLSALDGIRDAQAIMVGNGFLFERLRSQAASLSLPVHFWGSVPYDDLPSIFSAVDVCLYTFSRYIGGISQVIPLSMACGAVVVTTAIGDNAALVIDGVNGFLVGEGQTDAMRGIVFDILEDRIDCKRISINARNTIEREWRIECREREYSALLSKLQLRSKASRKQRIPELSQDQDDPRAPPGNTRIPSESSESQT